MTSARAARRRTTSRRFLLGAIAAASGVLLPLLLLEFILRFLPVTEPAYAQPVNEQMPYLHYLSDRDVTYSRGWRFDIVARKHVNNDGFTSDADYVRDPTTPLLAVIGDSYVEAWQVRNEQAMHGILAARLNGRGRVYGIGTSGSPLSQYLAYADMARRKYAPQAMAFVIIGNDFDESLVRYKREPGYHYFVERGGHLVLERVDHPGQSRAIALASRSSLAMYLRHTIGFDLRRASALLERDPGAGFVGNAAAEVPAGRIADSKAAVAAFLAELPGRSGLDPQNILFVVDSMRPQLYSPGGLAAAENSYFGQMRTHFMREAAAGGYEVVDLTGAFAAAFARDGLRLEFPGDNHWNEHGHRIVADEIARSRVFARTFARNSTG